MSEPLTIARFRALAEAYGGSLARWPMAIRTEALAMIDRDAVARAILREASGLDDTLDLWRMPMPADGLAEAMVRSAPRRPFGVIGRIRWWWAIAGLVAALAGAASGSLAAAAVIQADQPSDGGTAFGDISGPDQ